MNRYKPIGWRMESYRHSLAAKGIKTSFASKRLNFGSYTLTSEKQKKIREQLDKELEEKSKEIEKKFAPKRLTFDIPDELRWQIMREGILIKSLPKLPYQRDPAIPVSELYTDADIINVLKAQERGKEKALRLKRKEEAELGMKPDEATHDEGPLSVRRTKEERGFAAKKSGKEIWQKRYPALVKPFPGENPRITAKFARFRQEDPSRFQKDSIRMKKISKDTVIIIGKLKDKKKMSIQSVLKRLT